MAIVRFIFMVFCCLSQQLLHGNCERPPSVRKSGLYDNKRENTKIIVIEIIIFSRDRNALVHFIL